uniref:(California timema) hypothetical protein n=1 Tax=Timema californicum TaxID=61474 RepID=A0A7R9PDF3_TIMCA|nr:unnamed protein product [Timema californicum]
MEEAVRPLEKAGPRKETVRGPKKRKSAILTDTPIKMALFEEQEITKRKKEHHTFPIESENENEDCLCIHCFGPYSNSKRGEDWVKCTKCERWAHADCIPGDIVFCVYFNCDSDNDISDNDGIYVAAKVTKYSLQAQKVVQHAVFEILMKSDRGMFDWPAPNYQYSCNLQNPEENGPTHSMYSQP